MIGSTVVVIVLEVIAQLLLGVYVLGADWPDDPVVFSFAILLGAAAFAALGLAVTTVVRTAEGSSAVVNAITCRWRSSLASSSRQRRCRRSSRRSPRCPSYFLDLIRTSFLPGEVWARRPWPCSRSGPLRPDRGDPTIPLGAARGHGRGPEPRPRASRALLPFGGCTVSKRTRSPVCSLSQSANALPYCAELKSCLPPYRSKSSEPRREASVAPPAWRAHRISASLAHSTNDRARSQCPRRAERARPRLADQRAEPESRRSR